MDSDALVLEISSDEEDTGPREKDGSSPDWLSELLDNNVEDFWDSDVVVVDELSCAAAAPKQNTVTSGKPKDGLAVGDDDECMILEGDPDRPMDVVQEMKDESDDLLIVAEKGQLACRDYPHPRHLCATFPFSSSAHEKYCDQCHCYVCDSLAPCIHWGNGTSSADHCHSTDKEDKWKMQRQSFKQCNSPSLQKAHDNNFFLASPCNKSGGSGQIPAYFANSLISQSQTSRTPRACSGSNFGTSIISRRYNQQPSVQCRQRASRSPIMIPNHAVQRERQTRILPPRMSPSPNFKKTGSPRPAFASYHMRRTRQVLTANNQVARTPAYKNQHQPAIVPHSPHQSQCSRVMRVVPHHPHQSQCPPATLLERNNQCPPVIPEEGANLRSFEDMLAGLESDLSLTENSNSNTADIVPRTVSSQNDMHSQSSGWNVPQVPNADLVWSPVSHFSKSNLTGSQPYTVPSEPDLHSPSFSKDNPSLDANAVASSVPTNLNSFQLDGALLNDASHISAESQIPDVQPISLPVVANSNLGSGDVLGGDWMSIFKNASTVISHDPAIPPGLPSPEPFMFDFEIPWNGLW